MCCNLACYLTLAACGITIASSHCLRLEVVDTRTMYIDGVYTYIGPSHCSDRQYYKHRQGQYFMYYYQYYWYVGDDICGQSQQYIRVRSLENYPEDIDDDWQEVISGLWKVNDDIEVKCAEDSAEDGLSAGAIAGITIGVLVSVIIIILVAVYGCKKTKSQKTTTTLAQATHTIALQAANSDQTARDISTYSIPHGCERTVNGSAPSADLHFDIPPPSYAESMNKPQHSVVPPPYSSISHINAGTEFSAATFSQTDTRY